MEILYYYTYDDEFSILLQAPCQWANDWFASQYDTTLTVEYTDHLQADISQHYLPQAAHEWLAQLPTDTRHSALEKFVQFCTNVSIGACVTFS